MKYYNDINQRFDIKR